MGNVIDIPMIKSKVPKTENKKYILKNNKFKIIIIRAK